MLFRSAAVAGHEAPSGDVVATDGGAAVPANQTADITGITVTHAARKVTTAVTLRSVAASGWNLVAAIRTPAATYRVTLIDLGSSSYVALSRKGKVVDCAGLTRSIDATNDRVGVGVPRSCIGRPDWVRVGAVVTASQNSTVVADDARLDGALTASGDPKLGGRVAVG